MSFEFILKADIIQTDGQQIFNYIGPNVHSKNTFFQDPQNHIIIRTKPYYILQNQQYVSDAKHNALIHFLLVKVLLKISQKQY